MGAGLRLPIAMNDEPTPAWADDALVRACLVGDERAWHALVDKYKRLIYSIALRYHATPDDAADIFQSVCLELYSELGRLRQAAALRGWLITVTMHAALRWRKQSVRREQVERSDVDVSMIGDPHVVTDDDRSALDRAQDLREAIASLPPRCQAMVHMLFFEDPPRPYAEVAASLGLATGSIGFIRGRCLDKLKKAVER
ncbi:MAG TPA: sigma-70 family RNA polymerase sigma factor [Vicinamibacterales bacterium]|jgi:RNA polymerase sigma factor (sigma-70 family)